MDYGDEAALLEEYLAKKIAKLNQDGEIKIYKNLSIYETKTGQVLAAILVVLMICWPIVALLNSKDFPIGLAAIFYSGASFYIYRAYRFCKDNPMA